MSKLICQSVVKELLRAGISYRGDSLINYLISQADAPPWDTFLIGIPLRKKYWEAMVELQKELVPNHISIDDLYISLWNLFKEVVLNRSAYQIGSKLDEKIIEFSRDVKKPLRTFDVIYEIKNLDVGSRHFTLGNVEIFKLTAENMQSLGLTESGIASKWEGRCVAKVGVNASEVGLSSASGITEVNDALNVLRLATREELLSSLSDYIFWWELGKSMTISKSKPEEGILTEFGSGKDRPLIIDLGERIANGLDDKSIWKHILDGKLPEDINRRIIRAIEWISHGITASSLDYKLVDLCTALEILLVPESDSGTKGELIALRQVLIGRGSGHTPAGILYLYEKRCNIIHSGTLEITSYLDYWRLLICCLRVLENIVHLSQRNPNKCELEALLSIVENKETLQNFIRYCELGMYEGKGINRIKKAAKKLSEQCNSNSLG